MRAPMNFRRSVLVGFCWIFVACTLVALGQQRQCDEGILRTAAGNGQITICRAVAERDPQLAGQLTAVLDLLSKQQIQINRLVKNVNNVGQDLELKQQGVLVQSFIRKLDARSANDAAATQRTVANLTYGLDDLREELEQVRANPETAARTQTELAGNLGNAISRLDLPQAQTLLGSILDQLKEINTKLDRVEKNTAEIRTTVQAQRISAAHIREALEAADMSVLSLTGGTPVEVIAKGFSQRTADGKQSVAKSFFGASLRSPEALQWLDSTLARGLDPNLTVPADYYPADGILTEAQRAGNVAAVKLLLKRGASPHAFEDLFLSPYPAPRFLWPLSGIVKDSQFTQAQQKELAQAFLDAGAVVPKVYPGNGLGLSSEMAEADDLRKSAGPALGLDLKETPSLCEQTSNPICQAATRRTGVDWCALIARMPRRIIPPLDGTNKLIYEVRLDYLLQIADDQAYFLGYESAYSDYVLVKVARDSSSWTVLRYMDENYAMGRCRMEDTVAPKYCWRQLDLHRVGNTNEMQWSNWHQSWTLSQHACTSTAAAAGRGPAGGSEIASTSSDGSRLKGEPVKAAAKTAKAARSATLPGVRFRTSLLMLRDNPDLLDRYGDKMAEWDLYGEGGERNVIDQINGDPPQMPDFNAAHPAFVYDWSELQKSNPALAFGEALDVYLEPGDPWDFLKRTPGWDPTHPKAYVAIFVFPASATKRDAVFAAHDMAPLLKVQMLAAAKRESSSLSFPFPSPRFHYDLHAQQLVFDGGEPAERMSDSPRRPDGQAAAGYNLIKLQEFPGDRQITPGGYRKSMPELERWRSMLGLPASVTELLLDRQLKLPAVPLDSHRAEALHLGSGGQLTVTLFVNAEHLFHMPGKDESQYGMDARVNRIEIADGKGEVVAMIRPEQLEKP